MTKRREKLAINLFDVNRQAQAVCQKLLAGKVDPNPLWIDHNEIEETAIGFTCDLLTAAAICDLLRQEDRKAGQVPSRVYVKRRSWIKLSSSAVLTVVVDGEVVLNQDVFEPSGEDLVPPPVKRFK